MTAASSNPLLQSWTDLPPFDALRAEHFAPAFDVALREHLAEFDAIAARAELLHHVYAAGDAVEPRAAYRAFRGRDAAVEPMLAPRGLLGAPA